MSSTPEPHSRYSAVAQVANEPGLPRRRLRHAVGRCLSGVGAHRLTLFATTSGRYRRALSPSCHDEPATCRYPQRGTNRRQPPARRRPPAAAEPQSAPPQPALIPVRIVPVGKAPKASSTRRLAWSPSPSGCRGPEFVRHLQLASLDGPALVPVESANALVRVELPSGRALPQVVTASLRSSGRRSLATGRRTWWPTNTAPSDRS
jgi:hypothetical protein